MENKELHGFVCKFLSKVETRIVSRLQRKEGASKSLFLATVSMVMSKMVSGDIDIMKRVYEYLTGDKDYCFTSVLPNNIR